MKNIVYVTLKDFSLGNADGVVKKINNQIECFRKSGFSVDLVCINEKQKSVMLINADGEREIAEFKRFSGIFGAKEIAKYLKDKNYDAAYIRYFGRTDPWFLDVLKTLKKNNVKILVEIPTYPYDKEKKWWDLVTDKAYRGKLKKYVDRIVTFSHHSEILGIRTINTRNGVDIEKFTPRKCNDTNESVNLIAVADFEIAHGYERILNALADYYENTNDSKREVYIHMVGKGVDSGLYEGIVSERRIDKYVTFYGKQYGDSLNDIYDKADIGIGCLGLYKKGLEFVSSLKSVEYLAKGLPVINGFKEDIFEDEKEFVIEFSNDDSIFDINDILSWYDSLLKKYGSKEKLLENVRIFARKKADIRETMKPVIEYINK